MGRWTGGRRVRFDFGSLVDVGSGPGSAAHLCQGSTLAKGMPMPLELVRSYSSHE